MDSDFFQPSSLIGSTIPVVPSMDMPPTIPSLGLKVFFAISTPSGANIVIFKDLSFGKSILFSPKTLETSLLIIFIGTGLMACLPTSTLNPFFVTKPTPMPPVTIISSSSLFISSAFAKIFILCVASISSPPSFWMEQVELLSQSSIFLTPSVRGIPFGVSIFIFSIFLLVKSI